MNIPTILTIALLGSVAANFLHWRGRSNERFLYYPQSGSLRFVMVVALFVATVSFMAGFISELAFLGVTFGMTITHELYSIARRQYQRARP